MCGGGLCGVLIGDARLICREWIGFLCRLRTEDDLRELAWQSSVLPLSLDHGLEARTVTLGDNDLYTFVVSELL